VTVKRIKVTGYFVPEPDDIDESSPTGLKADALEQISVGLTHLNVSELEDLKFEKRTR
jgi:hypothetical protein